MGTTHEESTLCWGNWLVWRMAATLFGDLKLQPR